MFPPSRIVCLTEETVEAIYLLGEQDRIVGISGYVVRPPQARREKPRVSAFTSANIDKILALKPDLVLTFSDLQADNRRGSHSPRAERSRVQSTERRRDSRYDQDARRNDRCQWASRGASRHAGSRSRPVAGALIEGSRVCNGLAAGASRIRTLGPPSDRRRSPRDRQDRRQAQRGRRTRAPAPRKAASSSRPNPPHRLRAIPAAKSCNRLVGWLPRFTKIYRE